MAKKLVVCTRCGAKNPAASSYCSSCGEPFQSGRSRTDSRPLFPFTAKPVVGGILAVIGGAMNLFIFSAGVLSLSDSSSYATSSSLAKVALSLVCAVVAIFGGTQAIIRKHFGVAVAGAMCAFFAVQVPGALFVSVALICGIGSFALISVSYDEFIQQAHLAQAKR